MTEVPKLDRLTPADTSNFRFAGIWKKVCDKIEAAFGEIIANQVTIAAVQAALATKAEIYRQDDEPVGATEPALWLDSDDGDKAYWLVGGSFVAAQDIGAAYARLGVNSDGTIKDDKVLTSSVVAGAVLTTPGGQVTASTTLSSGSYTWTDCGSVTVTASGVEMTVRVDFDCEVIDNCKFKYRVLCDGATIGRERGPVSVNTSDNPGFTIVRKHTPSSGSRTYKLQCAVNDAGDLKIHDPVFDLTENNNL